MDEQADSSSPCSALARPNASPSPCSAPGRPAVSLFRVQGHGRPSRSPRGPCPPHRQ
uniref:Uncharacterized protein n=1 Tax=Arundo donax TaxID=35708 RepID=A0A0A9HE28_ARUDO